MALTFDAILNHKSGMATLRNMDWSVVVLWLGVFVWMEGLHSTKIPQYLWHVSGLTLSPFSSVAHVAILCAVVMVMAAMMGNVATTLILLMQLMPCATQLSFALLLVWLAAIGGNLTLYSSVSNVLVAHRAHHTLSHKLTFWKHLQYGFLTTLTLGVMGVVIISGLLQLP